MQYDDGDSEWMDLESEDWVLESEGGPGAEAAPAGSAGAALGAKQEPVEGGEQQEQEQGQEREPALKKARLGGEEGVEEQEQAAAAPVAAPAGQEAAEVAGAVVGFPAAPSDSLPPLAAEAAAGGPASSAGISGLGLLGSAPEDPFQALAPPAGAPAPAASLGTEQPFAPLQEPPLATAALPGAAGLAAPWPAPQPPMLLPQTALFGPAAGLADAGMPGAGSGMVGLAALGGFGAGGLAAPPAGGGAAAGVPPLPPGYMRRKEGVEMGGAGAGLNGLAASLVQTDSGPEPGTQLLVAAGDAYRVGGWVGGWAAGPGHLALPCLALDAAAPQLLRMAHAQAPLAAAAS